MENPEENVREALQDEIEREFWIKLAKNKAIPRLLEALNTGWGLHIDDRYVMQSVLEVLNRAYGKSKELHELSGRDGKPLQVEWVKMNSDESHDTLLPKETIS